MQTTKYLALLPAHWYATIADLDALCSEFYRLFCFVARNQPATGVDNAPPRRITATREIVAHSSGRSRVTGLGGNFAVGHDLARLERGENAGYRRFENLA